MQKNFAIVPGTLKLSFTWQAASSSAACGNSTTAGLQVLDATTSKQLYAESLSNSGAASTGWVSYSKDLSSYVATSSAVTIQLYLGDCWGADCGQQNWYKDIVVTTCP